MGLKQTFVNSINEILEAIDNGVVRLHAYQYYEGMSQLVMTVVGYYKYSNIVKIIYTSISNNSPTFNILYFYANESISTSTSTSTTSTSTTTTTTSTSV